MRGAVAVLDKIWGLGEYKMSFGWSWSVRLVKEVP
jgi:hypothetical protein